MNSIVERLKEVRSQIENACQQCNRSPDSVQLLAVSKTKPASAVHELYQAGHHNFGENYLQEALTKQQELTDLDALVWHFIGPIQSNKTRDIATHFDWVQSIDRVKIARRLNEQRPNSLPPLQVLIQVNIDAEASKSGVPAAEVPALAEAIVAFPRLTLRGLMTIPAADGSTQEQAASFTAMQRLYSELASQYSTVDTLSMGMSNDLAPAIAAGCTMVHVGTALFGARETT